ncbi:MAG: GGDEF domain-containing protein [Lachnospiraceae bacterium]|nr:GGDEF domain-containing protein [Lachnospiraceae bacterium]
MMYCDKESVSRGEPTDRRLTVGVLVSGILDDFTQHICNGIMAEAQKKGVDTIFLPGKYLDRDLKDNRELMYEYQHSTVFSYLEKGCVDALIIAADCIGCFTTQERMRRLLHQYDGIPIVLIAARMDGYLDVTFENESGIREGLEYLIDTCGFTRIGMIGGHENNTDAVERHEIFRRVLSEHGLALPAHRYTEGDLSSNSDPAYRAFLDENPDLEAVFCVNDDTALGLYQEMHRRGLMPGRDLSVFGFDDTPASAKAFPPLSTVLADPNQLGEAALHAVLELCSGQPVKEHSIPTRFILRDSIRQGKEGRKSVIQILEGLESGFHDIFYHNYHAEAQIDLENVRQSYIRLFEYLAAYFMRKGDSSVSVADIGFALDDFLSRDVVGIADMDGLMTGFEQFYHALLEFQTDTESRFELRNAFSTIYRKIIRAMNRHSATVLKQEYQTNYDMKLFVQNLLQFEHGTDESFCSILENLDWLQIRNAWLYLLPAPLEHQFLEPFDTPAVLELKAVLKDGRVRSVPQPEQAQTLREMYQNTKPAGDDAHAQIMLPLFFGKIVYGVLICDMAHSLYVNGEFLINQLSSAIKMITLLQANEKIQAQLEVNLEALRDHNIELDTISKSDPLTGILNLRGFYALAEERFEALRQAGRHQIVLYIDMNNLKIVNDRFGHREGDSSLHQIGQVLKELVSSRGIAGRVGGDEFTCLIETRRGDNGEELIESLYRKFDRYNRSSDKPYLLTVSAGACPVAPDSDISLKEALIHADQKLYEVKKERKWEVIKHTCVIEEV